MFSNYWSENLLCKSTWKRSIQENETRQNVARCTTERQMAEIVCSTTAVQTQKASVESGAKKKQYHPRWQSNAAKDLVKTTGNHWYGKNIELQSVSYSLLVERYPQPKWLNTSPENLARCLCIRCLYPIDFTNVKLKNDHRCANKFITRDYFSPARMHNSSSPKYAYLSQKIHIF